MPSYCTRSDPGRRTFEGERGGGQAVERGAERARPAQPKPGCVATAYDKRALGRDWRSPWQCVVKRVLLVRGGRFADLLRSVSWTGGSCIPGQKQMQGDRAVLCVWQKVNTIVRPLST